MHRVIAISWISILTLFSLETTAQPELGECERDIEEVSMNQFKRAQKAWEQKNQRELKRNLDLAIRSDEYNYHALYYLGEYHARTGDLRITEAVWMRLLDICPNYKGEVLFKLGVILLENGQHERGIDLLERYTKHPEREKRLVKQAQSIIDETDLVERLKSNPLSFNPQPLAHICTEDDEYLAVVSPDGEMCFFTRRSEKRDKYGGPAVDKKIVKELFSMARLRPDGTFGKGGELPSPFNEGLNEGGPSVDAANRELYFTVCKRDKEGYQNCDIYMSKRTGMYWSVPESVGDNINKPDSWESQPSISPNADKLFFASNRKGGKGGIDLYVSERLDDGRWGDPRNLGSAINTPKDEKSPFIHSDGVTLYFSSNGHPGLGGFDVYYATYDGVEWGRPQNIGYPINTEEDDLGLTVSLDGTKGYFSSNTLKGKGGWDVFYFDMPDVIRPQSVTLLKGRLVDEHDQPELDAELEVKNLNTRESQRIRVDETTGEYAAVVTRKPDVDHIVTVKKKGAAFSSKFLAGDEDVSLVSADLEVRDIIKGEAYRLNDITFATNSYDLNRIAKAVIEEFIGFLESNPNVNVEIQGHTDDVGSDADNLQLSKNRARVVYDYMVANGITKNRLRHDGFGASKPVAPNESESGRAKNRRTVFVIR